MHDLHFHSHYKNSQCFVILMYVFENHFCTLMDVGKKHATSMVMRSLLYEANPVVPY
jgi:hypothetical protein